MYQDRLVFSIKSKMNLLNENVFNLLSGSADNAEERKQDLYIIPVVYHFLALADLKFMSHCIDNKIKLEQLLKLRQQAIMRLKYFKVNKIFLNCSGFKKENHF